MKLTGARILWIYGAIVIAILLGMMARQPVILSQLRENIFDQYQRIKPRIYDATAPVRVVDIDEDSLAQYGQWPWPRTYLAELTQRLHALKAGAVGFDILFPEPDRTSPQQIEQAWRRFGRHQTRVISGEVPDHDVLFAAALKLGPSVLALSGGTRDEAATLKAGVSYTGDNPAAALSQFEGVTNPIAPLFTGASGVGSISLSRRQDGILRISPMVVSVGDQIIPSLSLELLRVAQGANGYIMRTTQASGEVSGGVNQPVNMKVGTLTLPLTAQGHMRPYFTRTDGERIISAHRILAGDKVDAALASEITGRIILVGSSATGLFDIVTTPLAEQVPGVTIHAQLIEQIIAQQFLIRPDWAIGAEAAMLVMVALILLVILSLQRPILGLLSAGLLAVGTLFVSWIGFAQFGFLLDPSIVLMVIVLLYVPSVAVGFWQKERARAATNLQFAHFVPAPIIKKIADDPQTMLTPGGAARDLTIMFIDVRRFSTLTEQMSPEKVVAFVNDFLTPLSDLVVRHHGTIDKFIGDAIMAFWNAPAPLKNHATHAADMILALNHTLEKINQSNEHNDLPIIQVGVGANKGPCAVGMMGSKNRLGYSCIGDAVNLASRLEGLTKLYGFSNCIGEQMVKAIGRDYVCLELDVVAVKGRVQPEKVYALLARSDDAQAEEIKNFVQQFSAMRACYCKAEWQQAQNQIIELKKTPSGRQQAVRLLQLYEERLKSLQNADIGPHWDGVFVATQK